MVYAIFALVVSILFIAIPVLAFTSFLYVVITSHVATSSARAIIKRDEVERRFDAQNAQELPHKVRPSQSRLLISFLASCAPGYRMHSDQLFSFDFGGFEIYLELATSSDGFTSMTFQTPIATKIGLTSQVKNLRFEGLNETQEIRIANERYNFGDLHLVQSGFLDNLDLIEFQSRIQSFIESAETCINKISFSI